MTSWTSRLTPLTRRSKGNASLDFDEDLEERGPPGGFTLYTLGVLSILGFGFWVLDSGPDGIDEA